MSDDRATPGHELLPVPDAIVGGAKDIAASDGFRGRVYRAISIQRPLVQDFLRALRREKPDATAAELLRELDRRYVATVTTASAGVGASAAIPGVGVPVALGLGAADLLFFYETSALYVLSVAELHGIAVDDADRARPLVFGMLLGEKSQNRVGSLVLRAAGAAGGAGKARTLAAGAIGPVLPKGWGEVLTQQLPDLALGPLTVVIANEALKTSAKLGAGTLGKAIPFGIGAVVGGVGSFVFGRDVVKAAHIAFPEAPVAFPEWLEDFQRRKREPGERPRAVRALLAASGAAAGFGGTLWGRARDGAAGASRAVRSLGSRIGRGSRRAAPDEVTAIEDGQADAT